MNGEGEIPEEGKSTENTRMALDVMRETGLLALKSLITLNSGAFIVLLTYIGNGKSDTEHYVPLIHLQNSMQSFMIGIAATIAGMILVFVASAIEMHKPPRPRHLLYIAIIVLPVAVATYYFGEGVTEIVENVTIRQVEVPENE